MGTVLIIGAGGVGHVTAHKCALNAGVFTKIHLASRTITKPNAIKRDIKKRWGVTIRTHVVDANLPRNVEALIKKTKPDVVINVALPYQDLAIMEACLARKVHYIDTANYESPQNPHFEYAPQWAYHKRYKERGIMAVLGAGFDPGVTNAFVAYLAKKHFDKITYVDILDANAGDHGQTFATNFNPEINIREVTQVVRHWRNDTWVKTPPVMDPKSVHFTFNYPVAGPRESYLLYHEEMESLAKHFPSIKRLRFWMTFSDTYLEHLRVMKSIGISRIDPVEYNGQKIIPIQFLKALLPDPGELGKGYKGKAVIGCIVTGTKNGKESTKYIYNVTDHAKCFREVGSQAVSYTAGVPPVIAAMMVLDGTWSGNGVFNIEQLDPEPFLKTLAKNGLSHTIVNHKPLPAKI